MLVQLDDLYNTSKYLIPGMTFLIALTGSFHCLGMCGGLVLAFNRTKQEITIYHLGRLLGYILIGILISLIGGLINESFQSNTITLITSILMGSILIYWGLKPFINYSLRIPRFSFFKKLNKKLYSKVHRIHNQQNFLRSGFLGFISIFLPCGFLYGLVLIVAVYEDPILALASMTTFWLGTLPALVLTPQLFNKIIAPLRDKAPLISSGALISVGLVTITYRLIQFLNTTQGGPSCH